MQIQIGEIARCARVGVLRSAGWPAVGPPGSRTAATVIVRRTNLLVPPSIRPYFLVCALDGWRRVPVWQLAISSGIPFSILRRRLSTSGLTPLSIASWNLSLHATWLLDVAALPAAAVVAS